MKSLLYIFPAYTSFIKIDEAHLKQNFNVVSSYFNPNPKFLTPFRLIIQFIRLIISIGNYQAIVIQFAGYHSILPVIVGNWFKKPVIIIVAGTDAAYLPSIHYGNYRKKILAASTAYSLRHCSLILPVDKSLIEQEYLYDMAVPKKQGYKNLSSDIHTSSVIIPYGFDINTFYNKRNTRQKNTFITVTQSTRPPLFYRKGIDLIIEAARRLPDFTFIIIGDDYLHSYKELPSNIILRPRIPHHELIACYNQYEFYLQLSMYEGFPNALGEAMLCGCIPIGSSVSAIPYMIADCGFILPTKNVEQLVSLLKEASMCNKNLFSQKAEERIKTNFTSAMRQEALSKAVASCITPTALP